MKYPKIVFVLFLFAACQSEPDSDQTADKVPEKKLSFTSLPISQEANLWWARTLADVDGDQIIDLVLIDNNGAGGWLGYLKGNLEGKPWERVIVAETSPNGKKFAAGDLACGDLDADGDVDLIGVEHPGEWTDADATATLFWYEQDGDEWKPHLVGEIPSALKDISLEDLNKDGLPEIVTVTYNEETLSLFGRRESAEFSKVWDRKLENLHEGMDVGDLDGDGWPDIAANGYWLRNPGDLAGTWDVGTIDSQWFSQMDDHWSRNATKVVCADVDGDNREEVFITHSEKGGYPLAKYDLEDDNWHKEVLLDSIPAAHSLVVVDLDLDGVPEVLTGVNRNRAINIVEEDGGSVAPTEFPVIILKGKTSSIINQDGVYNLLAADLEGDGDIDLFRLTSHDEKDMWLMRNDWIQ